MRIVAGAWRGRPLVAPKGHSTRPTADRTRQALFNVLEHAPWSRGLEGRRIVDLFAGSGALGFEGLSRGASFCLFIDPAPEAARAIAANAQALGARDRVRVQQGDATALGTTAPEGPFDVAFLDPPYRSGLVGSCLSALRRGGWLAPGALVVVERGVDEDALPVDLARQGYRRLAERRWGAARVDFLETD